MKTALVHDWLITEGGAEKVLELLAELVPGPIHTLLHDPKGLRPDFLKGREIRTSFLQKWPFSASIHRWYLPFFPRAVESLDLSSADLIVSDSYCVAKGVRTGPGQFHLCYCYTPVRYA